MLWFITLLVLALAAFLIIHAYKAHAERQAAQRDRLEEGSGLAGNLSQDRLSAPPSEDTPTPTASNNDSSASVAGATVAASTVAAGLAANHGGALETGDTVADISEMIKILNLAEPDAGRLAVSREQFTALRAGDSSAAPDQEVISEVAGKLRRMLA